MGDYANYLLTEFKRYADGLLTNFTGRDWLVEQVRTWQANPAAKPFLLIQGGAGIGKSAFAAHLWKQGKVTAIHFCIAGRGGTTEPLTFVESVSDQLAVAIKGFSEARSRTLEVYARQMVNIQSEVHTGNVMSGGQVTGVDMRINLMGIPVEQAFDLLIRRPLWEVSEAKSAPCILIVVDSLDEALTYHASPTILDLLGRSDDLPEAVRWLLTSRPESRVSQALADLPVEILDAADPRHQEDVRWFLRNHLDELEATSRAWVMTGEALVELLGRKSEWNFLYLNKIWPDLMDGRIASAEKLPIGLDGYYRYFLSKQFPPTAEGDRDWREWGATLMEVLLALKEPVDLDRLSVFLGWESRLTLQRVNRVAQMLSPSALQEGLYFRQHWSLAEFLGNRQQSRDWWCDLKRGHRQIAGRLLETWGGLENGLRGLYHIQKAEYGTRYLVPHLLEAGEDGQAYRLLCLEKKDVRQPVLIWYTVHERAGTPQDFERDLKAIWQAVCRNNLAVAEKGLLLPCVGKEVRCALIQASLHSLAVNLPPKLLGLLVGSGHWTPPQALTYLRQIPEEGQRANALAALAERLPAELLGEALAAAREIEYDDELRAGVLAALAERVARLPILQAYSLWVENLFGLAARSRRDLLSDLSALVPLIARLGGEEGIRETIVAIRDVTRWWP